jgi:Gas vesicle protein
MRARRTMDRRGRRAYRGSLQARGRGSLCESLSRVLDTGAVVMGELVISVAGVDLLYLNLNLLLCSVETLLVAMEPPPDGAARPPAIEATGVDGGERS